MSVQDLGVQCVRFFSTLLPFLFEVMMCAAQEDLRQAAIAALAALVKAGWPRLIDFVPALWDALAEVRRSIPGHP